MRLIYACKHRDWWYGASVTNESRLCCGVVVNITQRTRLGLKWSLVGLQHRFWEVRAKSHCDRRSSIVMKWRMRERDDSLCHRGRQTTRLHHLDVYWLQLAFHSSLRCVSCHSALCSGCTNVSLRVFIRLREGGGNDIRLHLISSMCISSRTPSESYRN